jgi:hypothetical protein
MTYALCMGAMGMRVEADVVKIDGGSGLYASCEPPFPMGPDFSGFQTPGTNPGTLSVNGNRYIYPFV